MTTKRTRAPKAVEDFHGLFKNHQHALQPFNAYWPSIPRDVDVGTINEMAAQLQFDYLNSFLRDDEAAPGLHAEALLSAIALSLVTDAGDDNPWQLYLEARERLARWLDHWSEAREAKP